MARTSRGSSRSLAAVSSTKTGSFSSAVSRHRATSPAGVPMSWVRMTSRCASGQSTWRTVADRAVVVDQVGGAALGAGQRWTARARISAASEAPVAGALDQQLPDDVGGGEGRGAGLAGPRLLDHAAQMGTGGGGEPAHVLGEGADLGAVEGQHAGEVRAAAERDGEAGGDVEVVDPPAPRAAPESRSAADRLPVRRTISASSMADGALRNSSRWPGRVVRRRSWPCVGRAGRPRAGRCRPARPHRARQAGGERRAGGPSTAPCRRDSISPRRTSACAVAGLLRAAGPRLDQRQGERGAVWRSRWGWRRQAGSTVRTPMTSPSWMSGSPWADRTPRPARSLSVARRARRHGPRPTGGR